MPDPTDPYLTPPPSRRTSLADDALLPPKRLLHQTRSSLTDKPRGTPDHAFPNRRHSLPLNARDRLPPLSLVDDDSGDDAEGEVDEDVRSNGRADKRRRVTKGGKSVDAVPSPRKDRSGEGSASTSPSNHDAHPNNSSSLSSKNGRPAALAPIKPIGFAAAREARRDDNGNQALPSPVVMGFDFKAIDEDQLKTVRDTISIKEQQQALIAARRREVAQSQPSTPKELTFKGWAPKDPTNNIGGPSSSGSGPLSGGGGVGRRREKTRDKVEKMSIVTSANERNVVPGSKSAPLNNQGLAAQQASPREPPSGSQTSVPPHILPPLHGYGHHGTNLTDPRTAPLGHRSRNGEEHEFARQQGPYYNLPQTRPLGRPYESQGNLRGPATVSDRRNFSIPQNPSSSSGRYEGGIPSPRRASGSHGQPGHLSNPSPTKSPHISRDVFLQPFNQLYDLIYTQMGYYRYELADLHHRYANLYSQQLDQMDEFKNTASASNTLLGNLQASADSLKDMVRYEVERNNATKDREIEELRERLRKLEERDAGDKGSK
uniref:Uncharacterized protein n=1 Tax=Kwoniella dejecticola CBS 10117 TaxID=1296121 RepID=A0A1A6ACH5_9TREE|nr:uncharacterized protein I303_01984 [Kwoniella dejecticola CBS 10117]OBR87772.1 hypothetical protein I303_01984 [Kwoniella dejecticola CBS 10117]